MTTLALASTTLRFLLAQAPSAFDVSDIEVESSVDAAALYAYDSDGEIAAEFVLWSDAEGRIRLDSVFPDGVYMSVVSDGQTAWVESTDLTEVAERMVTLEQALASITNKDVVICGGSLLVFAGACTLGNLLGCAGGAAIAAGGCWNIIEEVL